MKKNVTKLLYAIALVIIVTNCISCKTGRFIYYNFANITDYKIFPSRTAKAGGTTFYYSSTATPKHPKQATYDGKEITFDDFLEQNKTVAFLIIKNDTLQYEKYFNGYNEESVVASFSMAKSVLSILVGCAIDDGLIKSVNEPMIQYIPELKDDGLEKVTIEHLLQMTSGIKFNESYSNPFGDAATYYYGTNLKKAMFNRKPDTEPGKVYSYSSGDTQLLGLVLERALKDKTLTEYLEQKLWQPLGMEYDATWSLDRKKDGIEKTFCCLNARARDFAKLGRLYLNNGNWNGMQIVSKEWVKASTTANTTNGGAKHYKYQWWLQPDGSYMAQGILGQYIYVNPTKKLTIVRLGKNYGNANWSDVFASVAAGY